MKLYTLEYDFAGVQMSIQTNSAFELSKKLEEALEKEHLTPDSIVVKTTNETGFKITDRIKLGQEHGERTT